jgi:hypothetical protein
MTAYGRVPTSVPAATSIQALMRPVSQTGGLRLKRGLIGPGNRSDDEGWAVVAWLAAETEESMIAGNNLARVYQRAGHLDAAISLLGEVHEEAFRLLGDDHPTTITIRENLVQVLAERAERPDDPDVKP